MVEASLQDNSPLDINLPNEDIYKIDKEKEFINTHENFDMMMYFYGSKFEHGDGMVVIFFTHQGIPIPYSFKLVFFSINNNAKYKDLILGLSFAIDLKIERLMIYGDYFLIINQIIGIYEFHNELLKHYREEVIKLLKWVKAYKIEFDLRSSNGFVDTMDYLRSLITPHPHLRIQHVKVINFKESSLKSHSPSPLAKASICEISINS